HEIEGVRVTRLVLGPSSATSAVTDPGHAREGPRRGDVSGRRMPTITIHPSGVSVGDPNGDRARIADADADADADG
ncbi:MAG TPA: hypothetical protein VFH68_00525, partial [Polyangia bacterium]|nr:hypothetical protein [Polyangia bacterium]